MTDNGPYTSQTEPRVKARYCAPERPVGAGEVSYFNEAEDRRGGISRSSLEPISLT